MSMQMKMLVTFDGEQHEMNAARLGDLVAFERHFKVRASVLEPKPVVDEHGQVQLDGDGNPIVAADVALEWIAFLLWRSLRRASVIAKDVAFDDDFLDRIDDVTYVDGADVEDEAVDPSAQDQPHG